MTARTMAAPNPANPLSYRRVTQSQFLCRNRPSSFSLSLIAAPPVVKISRLPPDQTWSTFLFFFFFFFSSFLLLSSSLSSIFLSSFQLIAQHVWYFRVPSVCTAIWMATPVEFANQSTYSHPEVQKFKPTALRMAKA